MAKNVWNQGYDELMYVRDNPAYRVSQPQSKQKTEQKTGSYRASGYVPKRTTNNSKVGSGEYAVKKGDTLWAIAKAHGTTVDALRKANPEIKGDLIYPSQIINLGGGSSNSNKTTTPAKTNTTKQSTTTKTNTTKPTTSAKTTPTVTKTSTTPTNTSTIETEDINNTKEKMYLGDVKPLYNNNNAITNYVYSRNMPINNSKQTSPNKQTSLNNSKRKRRTLNDFINSLQPKYNYVPNNYTGKRY